MKLCGNQYLVLLLSSDGMRVSGTAQNMQRPVASGFVSLNFYTMSFLVFVIDESL